MGVLEATAEVATHPTGMLSCLYSIKLPALKRLHPKDMFVGIFHITILHLNNGSITFTFMSKHKSLTSCQRIHQIQ